jgi:DNA repair protein RecO (recombination protein O)
LALLTRAEPEGSVRAPSGRNLLSAFYLNELLLRLLHRHDAHPELFHSYHDALARLCGSDSDEAVLRIFEKRLLAALGYGLVLDQDVLSGDPIELDRAYDYWPDRGPIRQGGGETQALGIIGIRGCTLHALATERLDDASALREAKVLMRTLLAVHLGEKPLHSRGLFRPVLSTD